MSLARHALRILQAQLDEGQLTLRAIGLRTGDAASRVELFRQRLAEVQVRRTEVPGVVDGQYRNLVKQLDAAATDHAARLRGEVGAAVRALADGQLADAPAPELERQGRGHAAALVRDAVERWRTDRAAELEDAVTALDDRLTEDLLRRLADLRTAAHDLLQLDLSVPVAPQTFAVDRRFFYTLADTAGSTELLAGSVRRHLPGALARRRVQAWLERETDDLVERQVGRARADLQQRLRETCRVLASAAGRRYAESTERLVAALEAVRTLRDDTEQARRLPERDLAGRVDVLSMLSSRCQEIAGLDTAAAGNNEIEKVMGLT